MDDMNTQPKTVISPKHESQEFRSTVRENRTQATCPKFIFNPKVGQGMRSPDGTGMVMYDDKFDKVMKLQPLFPSFSTTNWRTCANVHSNNWRCVVCKMDLIMKWRISKNDYCFYIPYFFQQILEARRQVVNTVFIHWVTSSDKGTLGWFILLAKPSEKCASRVGWKNLVKLFLFGWNGTLSWKTWMYIFPIQGGKVIFLFQDMLVPRVTVMGFLAWQLCLIMFNPNIWPIYSDLSRGHPKWWFSKGIHPKMALN